jgi:glycosyltransferase involved in cell wall biosynthesis
MNKIVVGSIVYNEEHRFLEKYLSNIQKYANEIVLIDDGSTDNSLKMCKEVTKNVFKTNRLFIKDEVELRDALWCKCSELCNNGDFILIQDCDEFLHNDSIEHLKSEIDKCLYLDGDAIAWKLYDMWNDHQYREDIYWTAPRRWWVHMVRYNNRIKYMWKNTRLHCGRIPLNSYYNAFPSQLQILHMGYSREDLRQEKYNFYINVDKNGENGILSQYKSILDDNPNLVNFVSNYM